MSATGFKEKIAGRNEGTGLCTRNAIYEIFVDRFAADSGVAVDSEIADGSHLHHCGGTLDGIRAKLDYICKLGADAIYLTPIFRADSNHKYDANTYDKVDERFGGEAAFKALAAECKARGMGLILDGVFNHVGVNHEWFQRAKTGVEKDRFKFNGSPDYYECWRGHRSLPELNHSCADVQNALFTDEAAVIRKWLREGATGWRLDCANDLGLETCLQAAEAARAEGATDGVVGEVMTYAEEWAQDGRLDGVMNYYFRETVLGLVSGDVPVAQAAYNFKRMARRYNYHTLLRSWNLLASHDTPRLRTLVPCEHRRRLAYILAFSYPGVPMIYYGEEAEMLGSGDPDCRLPMNWVTAMSENATSSLIRNLSSIRTNNTALRTGNYLPMPQPGHPSLLVFARTCDTPGDIVIVVANVSDEPFRGKIFAPYSHLYDGLLLQDLLEVEKPVKMHSGTLTLQLPPWQTALYKPDDSTPGYSFFRGRG